MKMLSMFNKLLLFLFVVTVVQAVTNTVLNLDRYFEMLDSGKREEFIVGGKEVNQYVPYQVSLQITVDNKNRHFCGGSIIKPNRILTAAHCVNGQNATRLTVVAGIRDLRDTTGQRSKVLKYKMHEKYQEFVSSDIAIVYIDPPFQLDGERTKSIIYNDNQYVGGGQDVTLTGWGATTTIGTGVLAHYPNTLQRADFVTITNGECKAYFSQVSETEICASGRVGKGACNGDSGGPLVMGSGDQIKQVGVVSYGTRMCGSNNPDVYTRVSQFIDWIDQSIN